MDMNENGAVLQSGFMPHGYCFSWNEPLLWMHVSADVLTGLAYFFIAAYLVFFILKKREEIPFNWVFILFGTFIFCCGLTHFMGAVTIFYPFYWEAGVLKTVNAAVSAATAIVLIPLLPRLLALPGLQKALNDNVNLSQQLQLKISALETEVNQRKQAEKLLKESESQLRSVVFNAPFPMMIHAEDHQVVMLNSAWEKVSGYTIEDIPTTHVWTEKAYGKRMALVEEDIKQLYALTESVYEGEYVVTTKQGEKKIWEFMSAPLGYSADGRRLVISMAMDITQRRDTEDKLQTITERMDSTNKISPAIISVANVTSGFFTECNQAVTNILGLSIEEFTSTPFIKLIHPDDRQRTNDEINKLKEGVDSISLQNRFLCKNGEYKWLGWQASRINGDDSIYAVATDISSIKKSEQQREQLISTLEGKNTEIENFTYTVSHDLKGPLISIQGFVGMLRKDAAAGNQRRVDEDVEQITMAVIAMNTLLNELLEFSRVGRLDNAYEEASMNVLIGEVIHLLAGSVPNKLKFDIQPQLPVLFVDRPRILALFQNLIENAVKFMGDQVEPFIEIQADSKGDVTIYSIKDNGIGIAEAYHDKVFGMFEHLDPGIEGTGMGLALAKRIVEMHGGRIWLESEGEGCGTTLFFTLAKKEEGE